MPKGPALIDLKPKFSSFEESRSISGSARNRYDSLAANIFDDKDRDQEIFQRKCFTYIKKGNLENLDEVVTSWKKKEKVFSLNFKDETTGNTPIILAAKSNSKKIAKWLLQQGVDVTLRNNEQKTALELASSELRLALISGSAQNDLKHASWQGNLANVKKILEQDNADVNCQNEEGMTPLILASRDINLFEKLKIIKNYHPLKVIRMLLKHHADASIGDDNGKTAFHHLLGNIGLTAKEILKILLMKNVLKIDHFDSIGISPLHTACKRGDIDIVHILLNHGADVSTRTSNGKTPLHYAVTCGHAKLSELLIKQGADPTINDVSGYSAIDYAKKMTNNEILKILEKKNEENVLKEKHHSSKASKVFFDGFDLIATSKERHAFTKPSAVPKSQEEITTKSSEKILDDGIKLPALQRCPTNPPHSPTKSRISQQTSFPKAIRSTSLESQSWLDDQGSVHTPTDTKGTSFQNGKEVLQLGKQESKSIDELSETQGRQSPRKLPSLNDGRQMHNLFSLCPPLLPLAPQNGAGNSFTDPLSMVLEERELSQIVSGNSSQDSTGTDNDDAVFPREIVIGEENDTSQLFSVQESLDVDESSAIPAIPPEFKPMKTFGNERIAERFEKRAQSEPRGCYVSRKKEERNQQNGNASNESSSKIVHEMENARENLEDLVFDYAAAEKNNDTKSVGDETENFFNKDSNRISEKAETSLKFTEKKNRLKKLQHMTCGEDLPLERNDNCHVSEEADDTEKMKLLKKKVNKQNEEFLKEITEGKVRDSLISTFVKKSPEELEHKTLAKNIYQRKKEQKKVSINNQRQSRKTVVTNCIRIEVPGNCKKIPSSNCYEEKSFSGRQKLKPVKFSGLKRARKKRKLFHLSVLPGFENCLNDDSFHDMIFGKSLNKHLRSNLYVEERTTEKNCVVPTEELTFICPKEESANTGSEKETVSPASNYLHSDDRLDSNEPEDDRLDEKYKSIFDFYSDSERNDTELLPPEENKSQTMKNNQMLINECEKLKHLTVGKQEVEINNNTRRLSNLTGFLPMLSDQDDFFKQMTEIAFARGVGNTASSYQGSGYHPSKESNVHFTASQYQRSLIYDSIKRSSISTQTSSDDSECGDDDLRDWVKGNILGQGAYGTVYCALTNRGRMVAVKQVELNRSHAKEAEKQYKKLQEEIQMLKYLNHRYIVKFIGTSMEDNVVNIFMEHIPGGSLALVIKRFGPLAERVFQRYTRQIVSGIAYLHNNGIVHRDIKGANVMLSSGGVVKLIDFGCAKRLNLSLSQSSQTLNSCKGTPFWMAPEVIRGTGNSYKSDVWSVGCTVYEMATGKPPWYGSPCAAMYAIADYSTEIPGLPDSFSEESRDFVRSCLTRLPEDRPSAEQLQKHRFIAKGSSLAKHI